MLSPSIAPLLAVEGLQAWYGESHVLHGATFEVLPGEVVTLLGRNGAGKTTTLKSIMGIVGQRTGSVRYEGKELIRLTSDRIARLGIALCPEERGIFASLSVEENLLLPPRVRSGGLDLPAGHPEDEQHGVQVRMAQRGIGDLPQRRLGVERHT